MHAMLSFRGFGLVRRKLGRAAVQRFVRFAAGANTVEDLSDHMRRDVGLPRERPLADKAALAWDKVRSFDTSRRAWRD